MPLEEKLPKQRLRAAEWNEVARVVNQINAATGRSGVKVSMTDAGMMISGSG